MRNYNSEDLAYFAGFVDGEGHIGMSRWKRNKSYSYTPRFQIAHTDFSVLDWIMDKFGGNIGKGTEAGTENKGIKCTKDQRVWSLPKGELEKLLPDLMPYLKVKKPQSIALLEYIKKERHDFSGPSGRPGWYLKWQEETWKKLSELNHENSSDRTEETVNININLNVNKDKQYSLTDFDEDAI